MPTQLEERTFCLRLPDEFELIRDGRNLHLVCKEPPGVFHFTPQEVEDRESLPNLSRMLAGFLTRSGHPVATDELLRVTGVPGAHGFSWQYLEEENYHRIWLFGNQFCWLLITFVCPEPNRQEFQETLSDLLKTLRLRTDGTDS